MYRNYNGITMELQWNYNGITMELHTLIIKIHSILKIDL